MAYDSGNFRKARMWPAPQFKRQPLTQRQLSPYGTSLLVPHRHGYLRTGRPAHQPLQLGAIGHRRVSTMKLTSECL